MAARKISDEAGLHALTQWRGDDSEVSHDALATAVRYTLQVLATEHPGSTIEVRVPPFAAIQCGDGPRHTRGTPPNVIEMDADTWLSLAIGQLSWSHAHHEHRLTASGTRASLEDFLPVVKLPL